MSDDEKNLKRLLEAVRWVLDDATEYRGHPEMLVGRVPYNAMLAAYARYLPDDEPVKEPAA